MKKNGKYINCIICGQRFYIPKNRIEKAKYCSRKCCNIDFMGNIPWNKGLTKNDDSRLVDISKKTKKQMKKEYASEVRNKYKITEKARKVAQKRMKEDNWLNYKENRKKLKEIQQTNKYKDKISRANSGKNNGMYGKKPWNKQFPTKKWWEETKFVKLRLKCLERDNHKCVNCGITDKEKDLYCDHKIPYRICKEHKLDNLQMLCGSCHGKKTVKDIKLLKKIN